MQGAVSSLPEICARIADEARKRHCEVADLYNCLGWNRYNYAAQCVGSDGTHPVSGYRQMARYLAKYIK